MKSNGDSICQLGRPLGNPSTTLNESQRLKLAAPQFKYVVS